MKVGRNSPCDCGSGKKYKKCCLTKQFTVSPEMLAKLKTRIIEPFSSNGKLIGRPFITTEFQGHKAVAVGSRVYTKLPFNITFHEFIITFLKDIVGLQWGHEESLKPKEQQHLIVQWIKEMAEILAGSDFVVEDGEREIKSAKSSGNVQALLALAYDIYSIYHCAELPDELIARLKNKDQFQGAKYEIAVAGMFARAGFTIQWFPKSSVKQCEFVATHKKTNEKIYVEAKSRHRQGVFYTPGKRKSFSKMKADVHHLLNEALSKPTDNNPFMIFIDVNLPITAETHTLNKKWVEEIKKILDKYPVGTSENPDKFNSLFVTNYSWHYFGERTELRKAEMLTIIPLFPKHLIKGSNIVQLLQLACEQYGTVPGLFPADQ